MLSPEATRADFDVLRRALEEAHGGFNRFTTKAELDRRLDAHRARLGRPLAQLTFAGVLAEAIAELRDGHGRLEYDSLTIAALAEARVIPLRFQLEQDNLVVSYNDSPADTTVRPGMAVTSINGRSIHEIIGALLPKISPDGFIETGVRSRLARRFAEYYWIFIEQADRYSVAVRDRSGREFTAALPGILEADRRTTVNRVNATITANLARLDAPQGNIALQFLRDSSVARLRIRSFGGQGFPTTLDSAFRALRERKTRALILDLRGNGGGVDEYGALVVSYLTSKPFRYFDHIHLRTISPSFATWPSRTDDELRSGTVPHSGGGFRVKPELHSGVGEQQPAANGFKGELFVLIDGGSFSTTADVAAQLRSLGSATFIGEETAGAYEGNTSGLNALIVLPNSRVRMRVMMLGYWNAVSPAAIRGRGVIPQHQATQRVADILDGVDPALDKALALAMRTQN